MKIIAISLLTLTLAACGQCPEKPPVIEYVYTTKSAPAEMYEIPPYPALVITETTMQSDIAEWITNLEERSRELENKIQKLKVFFETK